MTMKPYIFLSQNYLNFTQDATANPVDIRTISETTPYTVTVYFVDRYGNPVNRTIDTLILQDTNIVNMTVEAANAGGAYSTLLTLADNTQSTVLLKAQTPALTSSIRVTVPDGTNHADISGKMGIYGFICNLCALTDSNYKIDANEGSFRVLNGDYIHWADYKKWVGKIKMENLPQAQFDLLTEQADLGEMTVVPYQDLEADGIYECAVSREYSWELDRKTHLFKLDLEFNEL
jgi:hypothetical protein